MIKILQKAFNKIILLFSKLFMSYLASLINMDTRPGACYPCRLADITC